MPDNKYIDAHGKHGIDATGAGHGETTPPTGGPEAATQIPGSENYGPAFGTSDPNEYPEDTKNVRP